jgi:hypothetical protein
MQLCAVFSNRLDRRVGGDPKVEDERTEKNENGFGPSTYPTKKATVPPQNTKETTSVEW